MKNIHLIKTDKPSRLIIYSTLLNEYRLLDEPIEDWKHKRHIYITNDEEIRGGKEWFLDLTDNSLFKNKVDVPMSKVLFPNCKKIILTTDPDLIKDGVQSIPDEFLESCEIKIRYRLENEFDVIPSERSQLLAVSSTSVTVRYI